MKIYGIYRGKRIEAAYTTLCPDNGIERYNPDKQTMDYCNGYYVQVYEDFDCTKEIDNFCLAVGYEIKNTSMDEVDRAIHAILR